MFRMAVFPNIWMNKNHINGLGFWKKQNYTAKENMTYDKVKLKKQLEKLECVKKENQTAPEDAYVAYKDSKFEIVPENGREYHGFQWSLSGTVRSGY